MEAPKPSKNRPIVAYKEINGKRTYKRFSKMAWNLLPPFVENGEELPKQGYKKHETMTTPPEAKVARDIGQVPGLEVDPTTTDIA